MLITLDTKNLTGKWFIFPNRKAVLVEEAIPEDGRGLHPLHVKGGELILRVMCSKYTGVTYRLSVANINKGVQLFAVMSYEELKKFGEENNLDMTAALLAFQQPKE